MIISLLIVIRTVNRVLVFSLVYRYLEFIIIIILVLVRNALILSFNRILFFFIKVGKVAFITR